MLPRAAAAAIQAALEVTPVVVVMGARQTGKTTLVRSLPALAGHGYVTLDDLDARGQAQRAPEDLLARAPTLVVDEVQRSPQLLSAIKQAIDGDRPRRPGRFVLTGSANLLLMHRVSETLAGRASYVALHPLARRERLGQGRSGLWPELFATEVGGWLDLVRRSDAPRGDWREQALLGGYPTPAYELPTAGARAVWFNGYVQTYLERDLQDLAAIDHLVDFRRVMRVACLRVGGLVNQAEIARDAGVPRPTVHRYLNLLEASYQLHRLEAYAVNRTKRLIKAPKLYWGDTGLSLFLAGLDEPTGGHLESVVLGDLVVWRDATIPRPNVLYWRTAAGEEVDLVVERGDDLFGIEVKAASRPRADDARGLKSFLAEYPDRARGGLLLHTGDEVGWIADRILAAPWWRVA